MMHNAVDGIFPSAGVEAVAPLNLGSIIGWVASHVAFRVALTS